MSGCREKHREFSLGGFGFLRKDEGGMVHKLEAEGVVVQGVRMCM